MEKCIECRFARQTKNSDYVGCAHWMNAMQLADMSEEQFAQYIFDTQDGISSIGLGWAYPHRRPNSSGDGTAIHAKTMRMWERDN